MNPEEKGKQGKLSYNLSRVLRFIDHKVKLLLLRDMHIFMQL